MTYDWALAARIRGHLSILTEFDEKKMFGGLCFLVRGHMCAGVVASTLMLRVGPHRYENALGRPHVREMDFTGRALRGMVFVDPDGIAEDADLLGWLRTGVEFVRDLPPKDRSPGKAQPKSPPSSGEPR